MQTETWEVEQKDRREKYECHWLGNTVAIGSNMTQWGKDMILNI